MNVRECHEVVAGGPIDRHRDHCYILNQTVPGSRSMETPVSVVI